MHPIIKRYYLIVLKAFSIIIKIVIIDQLTKWWLIGYLELQPFRMVTIFKYLNIVYVWNYGISFGLFSNHLHSANIFFTILNCIVVVYLFYILLNTTIVRLFVAYCLIIGGAIGNLYDRIFRGAVFDFIDVHFRDYHFAVFNLADSFITIGALLLIYEHYKTIYFNKDAEKIDNFAIEAEKIRNLDSKINH